VIKYITAPLAAGGFNIDPTAWKSLSHSAAGFGYQVVQRGRSVNFFFNPVPSFAVNMSLGLAMASDPVTKSTMACGPTIPKDCKSITKYNGACLQINGNDRVASIMPSSLEECQIKADIAFLLDGSGSVSSSDFRRMKDFVKRMIRPLRARGAQFAVVQFSSWTRIEDNFKNFPRSGSWEYRIDRIDQMEGGTHTAEAIQQVVRDVFSSSGGSRPNAKKVLIVITDGESNGRLSLPWAVNLAENHKIIRFVIGVGSAFSQSSAKRELELIASSPKSDHVFKVNNFDALSIISGSLQDRIFAIEGSQTQGDSLTMEMAQEGFSVAYVPGGGIQMATVGANDWRGGYLRYSGGTESYTHSAQYLEPDSYLGYSMAVAKTSAGTLTIVGAPRYLHRGLAMAISSTVQRIDPHPWQFQLGAYFGAEICAVDVDRDAAGYTDLVLISAPMFMDKDREGRVYICSLTGLNVDCRFENPILLKGDEEQKGRFGSTLALLPDLNSDGLNDLAVGAPLENDGQGSIYIFNGEGKGRLNPTYSQRIAGSDVQRGLQFFGLSISQSSFDLSGDSLPDLAVGSKGRVLLLRSKPIVMVETEVSFSPNQIPTNNADCISPLRNRVQICFHMTALSRVQTAQARINYTFSLDVTRKAPSNRAYTQGKKQEESGSLTLNLRPQCVTHNFFIEPCPEDALNELSNELRFTFEGVASSATLRPSLSPLAQTTTYHPLGFEINCGADEKCVDDLIVDFNFTSSSEVKVGIDELLNVTVSVQNRDENSYNSRVILTYPAEFSFRKFTTLQGRVECNSLDSEDGLIRGQSDCTIDKPIFKTNAQAVFIVSYGIDTNSQLDRKIYVTANATSGNTEHATTSEPYKMKEIDVKYSIFVSLESSLSYNNFTFGKNNLQKPVHHVITVINTVRAFNLTVVIKVPVKLGDKDIWVDPSSMQIPGCQRDKDEEPTILDFVEEIKKDQKVNCSVARCTVFRCSRFMGKNQRNLYNLTANISSGWIEQIGLKAAKFVLISTTTLEYDRNQYIFYSTGSSNNPPVRKIETEVEVYPETDLTKEIVGGSIGGLILLALITAGLYKVIHCRYHHFRFFH
uniref:Integrin, alpha M (complement component 3 receptor 3 subunit) n=1 Tax=Myripristis murdjan TaxID=586833 RepID=A0A667X2I5_9TELE